MKTKVFGPLWSLKKPVELTLSDRRINLIGGSPMLAEIAMLETGEVQSITVRRRSDNQLFKILFNTDDCLATIIRLLSSR